jgi:hypothetical protein
LPKGQSHAKATIALSCSLAVTKDVNGLMEKFIIFSDSLVDPGTHARDYIPIITA